jgi:hypothetical protein
MHVRTVVSTLTQRLHVIIVVLFATVRVRTVVSTLTQRLYVIIAVLFPTVHNGQLSVPSHKGYMLL